MITIIKVSRLVPKLEKVCYQETKRGNSFWIKDDLNGWIDVSKLEECGVTYVFKS